MAKKSSNAGLGALVLGVIALGLIITYWQIALLVGVGATGLGLVWWSQRSSRPAGALASAPRALPAVPAPPPAPVRPARAHVEPSERTYASELCPYCREPMEPPPKAKTRCKFCRQPVFVRTGPDGLRYLLQEIDLPTMEAEWATQTARDAAELGQAETVYAELLLAEAWRLTFEAMPAARCVDLSSDEEEQEVRGESHYQDALAEVSNLADGVVRRRDVVAVLVPEPRNPHDSNAVRVEVFGRLVGRIPREDAAEMSPILLALQKSGMLVASQAEIVGGGIGRSGAWLSFGIRLGIEDYSDWVQTLKGTVTLRTADSR